VPFDSACTFGFELDGPDWLRVERAAARFALAHPYLIFRRAAVPAIRRRAAREPQLRETQQTILVEAVPPLSSDDSRTIIKRRARRLIATAFAALTAERAIASRALTESRRVLAELAAAPSWKSRPVIRSFLDCAEIAIAAALAYDWLHDMIEERERAAIEQAIRRNVLEPALADYEDQSVAWPRRRDNCTVVSNAGIALAALAVLPLNGALAGRVLNHSLASNWRIFAGLAPDGAWREGLSYWSLTMRYAALLTAALESTFGDSFGLADRAGFAETGAFALYTVGPFGAAFNFGDSELRYDASPLAWFAHRFQRPADGWLSRGGGNWSALLRTIWPYQKKARPMTVGLPTGKIFDSGDLASFRNTWMTSPGARPVFVAIKGGNVPAVGGGRAPRRDDCLLHAQADAGTFVVDGARHRWVLDLGPDDYDLPGYFDLGEDGRSGRRWAYYRTQAAGHNTLLIGRRDQIPNMPAPIVAGAVDRDCKWVVLDLSPAYGKPIGSVRRGAALLGRQIAIEDELDPAIGEEIVWTMHISADQATICGSVARLRTGEDLFEAHILAPADARFELTAPPPPRIFKGTAARLRHDLLCSDGASVSERPYTDATERRRPIQRLQIALPAGTPRVTVLLLPDCHGDEPVLAVTPLADWLARRPLRLINVSRRPTASKVAERTRTAARCSHRDHRLKTGGGSA
jgi:hypothetical protein